MKQSADPSAMDDRGPEEIVFSGKVFEVIHQPVKAGRKAFTLEIARRAPGVRLIITDPGHTKFLITREHRRELEGWDQRLPGGKVFDRLTEYRQALTSGDDLEPHVLTAARREAEEEVGLKLHDPRHLGVSPCGATVKWDLYYVVCTKHEEIPGGAKPEPGEQITSEWQPAAEVERLCLSGELSEERSAMALLKFIRSSDT